MKRIYRISSAYVIVILLATLLTSMVTGLSHAATVAAGTAVEFTLNDINNKPHKLSDYRGKWVIVNYWVTWCPPCADEVPELNKFHAQHKDKDAVVLGINFEYQDPGYVREFIEEFSVVYPILMTKEMIHTPFGQLVGLPTSYLVSPEGKFVKSHIGPLTADTLESWIKSR